MIKRDSELCIVPLSFSCLQRTMPKAATAMKYTKNVTKTTPIKLRTRPVLAIMGIVISPLTKTMALGGVPTSSMGDKLGIMSLYYSKAPQSALAEAAGGRFVRRRTNCSVNCRRRAEIVV